MSNDDHLGDFDAFFRRYQDPLSRYVRALGVAAASVDDVVIEALFVVSRHWVRLRTSYPKAFLYKTARNEALKQVARDAPPVASISIDATLTDLPATQREIDGYADLLAGREQVKGLLESLPPQQRETLRLRFLEDFSVKETAEIMNVTLGTVTSQACRGLKRLSELVERGNDGNAKKVREQ
jgi:RNA polymerase sigma factor (sigma-70 family)